VCHPVLVFWLGAGSPARPFRKDHDLTIARELPAHAGVHIGKRLRAFAAIDRDHARLPGVPAEERDPHQFALHDVGRIRHDQQQCERLPQRLVLGGDKQGSGRNSSQPAKLDLDAANRTQQPEIGARPEPGDGENGPARHHQCRQGRDELHQQIEIEQDVENDRPNDEHEQTLAQRLSNLSEWFTSKRDFVLSLVA
jgi:hypothetical protein